MMGEGIIEQFPCPSVKIRKTIYRRQIYNQIMSSTGSVTRSLRKYVPIQIISTSLGHKLLGFILAFIGIQIISWVVEEGTGLSSTIFHTAIGTFVLFNGLYLGGVRFQ